MADRISTHKIEALEERINVLETENKALSSVSSGQLSELEEKNKKLAEELQVKTRTLETIETTRVLMEESVQKQSVQSVQSVQKKEQDEFQHKYNELQKRFILTEGKVEDLNEAKSDLENQLNELKETHKFALQENTQLRHDLLRQGSP